MLYIGLLDPLFFCILAELEELPKIESNVSEISVGVVLPAMACVNMLVVFTGSAK